MDDRKKASRELVTNLLSTLPLGDFFSPEDLANQLRWPTERVLEAIEAGELPARRVRGAWVLSKEAVNAYFHRLDGGDAREEART